MLEGTASPLDNRISIENHLENWRNVLGGGVGEILLSAGHSTWEGVINSTHTKGQQPLTRWFWKNLYILVDQSLKISQTSQWARERGSGNTSSKILPENTSHGNSFSWFVLSSFHPALHWTFEQSAENSNKKKPSSKREKNSWGIFSLKTN